MYCIASVDLSLLYPGHGCGVSESVVKTHTLHTCTWGEFRIANTPTGMLLGGGRKPENRRKNPEHADLRTVTEAQY